MPPLIVVIVYGVRLISIAVFRLKNEANGDNRVKNKTDIQHNVIAVFAQWYELSFIL